jgi:hypothetical protein
MTIGAVARAESLRLAGRWEEALAALDEMDTAEAWLERVQVLSDEHLFARDRGAEIQRVSIASPSSRPPTAIRR